MTALKKAQQKYEKTRTIKKVSFNDEIDADLIEHLKDKEFSSYVKALIKNDLDNKAVPVQAEDLPEKKEGLPRDPNIIDWVDDEPKPGPGPIIDLYRDILLNAYRGHYDNFPVDVSHLTEDIINSMSIPEIRGYTGYLG